MWRKYPYSTVQQKELPPGTGYDPVTLPALKITTKIIYNVQNHVRKDHSKRPNAHTSTPYTLHRQLEQRLTPEGG